MEVCATQAEGKAVLLVGIVPVGVIDEHDGQWDSLNGNYGNMDAHIRVLVP